MNNTVGKHSIFNFKEFVAICSFGKNKVNKRKARGVIAVTAKLILPQNKTEGDCFKMYSIKTVNPHPAQDQARTEKISFTRVCAPVFLYTRKPKPRFIRKANNKNVSGINNLDLNPMD